MSFKKNFSKSLALALVTVTVATPVLNSVSAMETTTVNVSQVSNVYDLKPGTVVEITDEQAMEVFQNYFPEEDFSNDISDTYASGGVTKIVTRKTGCDIYLSRKVAEKVIDLGTTAVGFLVGLIPGISTGLAIALINSLVGNISKDFCSRGIKITVKYPMTIVSIKRQ